MAGAIPSKAELARASVRTWSQNDVAASLRALSLDFWNASRAAGSFDFCESQRSARSASSCSRAAAPWTLCFASPSRTVGLVAAVLNRLVHQNVRQQPHDEDDDGVDGDDLISHSASPSRIGRRDRARAMRERAPNTSLRFGSTSLTLRDSGPPAPRSARKAARKTLSSCERARQHPPRVSASSAEFFRVIRFSRSRHPIMLRASAPLPQVASAGRAPRSLRGRPSVRRPRFGRVPPGAAGATRRRPRRGEPGRRRVGCGDRTRSNRRGARTRSRPRVRRGPREASRHPHPARLGYLRRPREHRRRAGRRGVARGDGRPHRSMPLHRTRRRAGWRSFVPPGITRAPPTRWGSAY